MYIYVFFLQKMTIQHFKNQHFNLSTSKVSTTTHMFLFFMFKFQKNIWGHINYEFQNVELHNPKIQHYTISKFNIKHTSAC